MDDERYINIDDEQCINIEDGLSVERSIEKIELSVGAVKIVDKYEIFTEEEIYNINGKVPELDERVGVIEDEIEEINSSLEDITSDLEGKADKSYVDSAIESVDVSSQLTNYATKSDLEVKADKSYVDSAIESVDVSSQLTNYATKSELSLKVDKVTGKSLISDSEIERLSTLKNYDDTEIKNSLNSKANKTDLHSHSNKSVLDGITTSKITEWNNKSNFSGNYNDLTNKPTIPTKTSQLTNDSGFITTIPSEYVTDSELNSKGYLTTHQNLSPYAKKTDLPTIVQEIGDSETAVMSQKAVTAFVKETISNYQPPESGGSDSISGGENYQYPVAVSVNQMRDTTKSYLSMETGTLWTYSEVEKEVLPYTNLFVKNDCLEFINQRVNSSQTYVTANGFISTPMIDISDIPAGGEIIVRTKGIDWTPTGYSRILCYTGVGTNLATIKGGAAVVGGGAPQSAFDYNYNSSGDWTFTITAGQLDTPIKSIRFVIPILPETVILATDISDNIVITVNEEIKEGTTVREYEWVDTGMTPTYDENTVFINSVEDCENTNRNYIMESTGTIWSYVDSETEVEYNAYDPATTKLNYRINSSLAEVSNPGTLLTDYIPLKYKSNGEQMTFKGINKLVPNGSIVFNLIYFDSTKTAIKSENGNPWGYGGTKEYTLPITFDPFAGISGVENAEYIRVRLSISTATIKASDVAGLVINVKSLNTKQIGKAWIDTNIKPSYVGTINVVNTVDEMIDVTRKYILKSTGTLWEYAPKKGDMINLYDPTKVQYNKRYSGTPGSIVAANGWMLLPEIPIDMSVDEPRLIIKHDGYIGFGSAPSWQKTTPLNAAKVALGALYASSTQASPNQMKTMIISEQEFHLYPRFNATGENSYWQDIKYIHIDIQIGSSSTSISSGGEHIIGIYNPDYCETVYEWSDTGIFIDDGSGGGVSGGSGNYLDLLIKVNKTQKEVDDLEQRLITVESNLGGEASVPSPWRTAVEECITNIKTHQVGIHCVTFPFFSDHHVRGGCTGLLISKVMKECNIPYCFFGGDSISSGYIEEEETMINQELQFKELMSYIPDGRFHRAIGNHDGYMIHENTPNVTWSRDQIYELFIRQNANSQLAHFGDDGTYFYIDDIPSKVRFVVLNPNGTYTQTQLEWLQNVAMKFDQPGWGIVFISHQGISAHHHSAIANVDEVRTILTNYKNSTDVNKADLISWHSGHIHRDRIYVGQAINTSDDQEGAALPVKNVTITSDNVGIAYADETKHANDGSNLSHAIDFVTINRKTRTVKITRLGIGEDREFTF